RRARRQMTTKSAVDLLQEQIEAVRREAFAAGYEAAMALIREAASRPAPDMAGPAPAPAPSAAPPHRRRRRAAAPPARPRRGANAELVAGFLRSIAPPAPPKSAAACGASAAWSSPTPRSARRWASSKPAGWSSRSPTARPGATSARGPASAAGPRGDRGAGERVGAFVLGMAGMAAHPVPGDPVRRSGAVEALPQIEILDRLLVRGAPAARLPAGQPAGDAVAHILAVGVERHPARPRQRLQPGDRRRQLHAVVGGRRLAAGQILLDPAIAQDRRPAARAGIAAAGAVGEDFDRFGRGHRRPRPACAAAAPRLKSRRPAGGRDRGWNHGGKRGRRMADPIPAQKAPYNVTVEAGKRYFWCACGRSRNQPFCDGSHAGTGLTPLAYT